MKNGKRKKLEKAGWRRGDAAEFLGMSAAEKAYVELKLNLAQELVQTRRRRGLTQRKMAALLETSQPRLAVMEKGDPSVSVDRLVQALLKLGVPAALTTSPRRRRAPAAASRTAASS